MNTEQLFRSLVTLVAIDGEIDTQELRFLQTIRQQLEIPDDVINSALNDAKQGKRHVHLPKEQDNQQEFLDFLIQAAYADGAVTPREYHILKTVAVKIGVAASDLDRRIDRFCIRTAQHDIPERKNHAPKLPGSGHGKDYKKTNEGSASKHSQRDSAKRGPSSRQCPKCGYRATSPEDLLLSGDNGNGECPACGIVFSRYLAAQNGREGRRRSGTTGFEKQEATLTSIKVLGGTFSVLVLGFLTCIPLVIVIVASSDLISGFSLWFKTKEGARVQATLQHVELHWIRTRGNRGHYDIEILYTYEYRGEQYTGEKVSLFLSANEEYNLKHKLKQAFEEGEPITCYVNIEDPSISIIDNRLYDEIQGILPNITAIPFTILGTIYFILSCRYGKSRRSRFWWSS